MTPAFAARLAAAHDHSDSLLCVGLDPDPKRFPSGFSRDGDGVKAFNRLIIDATAEHVCAFKPQIAYFAALGAEAALEDCIATIRDRAPHALVILDAKRGDIGDTAALYAREAFERYDADAVTVNPYLGTDSLEPFLAYEDRATIVLCRTSNVGGGEFQAEPSEAPLYLRVARCAAEDWSQRGNVMLVAGATYPAELAEIRLAAPTIPLLVPGVGAQGGDPLAVLAAGLDASGRGVLVNSSRAILYASSGNDFAEAAGAAAAELAATLRAGAAALQS
ncbi:MAG: orotidine-5'-phosphate decarboxylase [Pseudomonadota bacterium]|nr:orotidine-5'-phosphate decarboxylase [Pseudomonadota bacterium]